MPKNNVLRMAILFAIGWGLCGCTIIPGLHVSESPGVVHGDSYSTSSEAGVTTYHLQQSPVLSAVRIREINGNTLQDVFSERLGKSPELAALGSVSPADVPPEYLVGAGDILFITVWDHPELNNPSGQNRSDPESSGRLVSSAGTVFYPYMGLVDVAGKTVDQIRSTLSTGLAKVIQKPQIDVRVISFRSKRVQVTGEVKTPGLLTLDDTPKGVLEALAEKGGLSPNASRRSVLLTRAGKTYQIDLSGLLSGGSAAPNPPLAPGDIVHVPDRSLDQVFVLGEVNNQGPVYLQQSNSTLTEALTLSGGLDKLRANDGGVLVFRRPSGDEGVATVYPLDMASPVGLLLAGEFPLQPRDVVYVQATGFVKYNSVINQILPTISAIFQIDRLTK